ncbi:MAG: hypothetical protein ABIG91_00545 [Patescibacteria group bacterium]
MFDTAKLNIKCNIIVRDTGFDFKVYQNGSKFRKRYFNPDAKFIEKYGFHPKLTTYEYLFGQDWVVRRLDIEGSLKKMVWGSSYLFGLDESNIDLIIATIIKKLKTFGFDCSVYDIESGNVAIIAYCFNFYLPPEYARPKEFILPLAHLDVGKRSGNVIEKLWLGIKLGYGVKFWNKQRGIGFYDKVAEIENNKIHTEQDKEVLFLVKEGKLPHCFKIENTLQNRTAVKQGIAIFYDKDAKKERHIREVLKNGIAIKYLQNVFDRLSDGRDVKALEQTIYPLSGFYNQAKQRGLSFKDTQLLLAHCIGVQQIGSLQLKQLADGFPKYGRQYRQRYYENLEKIMPKVEGLRLFDFFKYCENQLKNPRIIKLQDLEALHKQYM